jgi:hypothetical protein
MRISRTLALLIGAATVWPLIYMIGFMASVVFLFAQTASNASARSVDAFRYILVLHMATMLMMLGLLAFYIVHVFKNAALRDDRRTLWALVLFLGGPVSMPVYWWLYVRPSP